MASQQGDAGHVDRPEFSGLFGEDADSGSCSRRLEKHDHLRVYAIPKKERIKVFAPAGKAEGIELVQGHDAAAAVAGRGGALGERVEAVRVLDVAADDVPRQAVRHGLPVGEEGGDRPAREEGGVPVAEVAGERVHRGLPEGGEIGLPPALLDHREQACQVTGAERTVLHRRHLGAPSFHLRAISNDQPWS